MVFGLREVLLLVAVILFGLSVWPGVPYRNVLLGLGLAFLAGGHLVAG
jgi:flagellar biosynthesis component FlhA